jgi:hypothetical protein
MPVPATPASASPVIPVPEAAQLLNEVFARLIHASSVVSNFRTTLLAVSSDADKHLNSKLTGMVRDLFEDPEWEGLLISAPTAAQSPKKPDYAGLAKTGAKAMLGTTYAQVDAATLIFYHSILDGVASDCLRVTALQSPGDWEKEELSGVQVGLREARDQSYEQLLRAKIDKRLAELEGKSLLTRIDKLFARCKPESDWSPMHGYAYDRIRIEQFDEQRHKLVHGNAIGGPLTLFPVTDESLFYILRTGMFLFGLINMRYGLQVNPAVLAAAAQSIV